MKREIMKLEDEGTVAIDWVINNKDKDEDDVTRPVVLLFPGFEGESSTWFFSYYYFYDYFYYYYYFYDYFLIILFVYFKIIYGEKNNFVYLNNGKINVNFFIILINLKIKIYLIKIK